MANKKTNLDVSVYTYGGQNFLEVIENAEFNTDIMTELCKSLPERYGSDEPQKKEFKFSADIIQHVNDECASGLTLSVFTVGGDTYLGEIESFDFDIKTELKFGDGPTEIFKWPQPTGTDYSINAKKFIVTNADWMALAIANDVTSIKVQVAFTVAGIQVSLPMTLSAAKHTVQGSDLQMENVTFKKGGTPTTMTGDALLIEILTGDAYLSWEADTDAGAYSGNAIIESAKLKVGNGALVKSSYEFFNQGRPDFVAAA